MNLFGPSDFAKGIIKDISENTNQWRIEGEWPGVMNPVSWRRDNPLFAITYRWEPRGEGRGMKDTGLVDVYGYASQTEHFPALSDGDRKAIYEACEKHLGAPRWEKSRIAREEEKRKNKLAAQEVVSYFTSLTDSPP